MSLIIPSYCNSTLEATLRAIDPKVENVADHYYWATVDDNNIVVTTFVGTFEVAEKFTVKKGTDYILSLQDSYNIAGAKANHDYFWDSTRQVFHPQQPYASWTLDTSTWEWDPPIAHPMDNHYYWDEDAYQADTANPKTAGWTLPPE